MTFLSRLSINNLDNTIMTNIATADALLPLVAMWRGSVFVFLPIHKD